MTKVRHIKTLTATINDNNNNKRQQQQHLLWYLNVVVNKSKFSLFPLARHSNVYLCQSQYEFRRDCVFSDAQLNAKERKQQNKNTTKQTQQTKSNVFRRNGE